MSCLYCGGIEKHDYRCPLADLKELESGYVCKNCKNPILFGEEYIVGTITGDMIHSDCYSSVNELVGFLGGDIKIMEEE